MSGAPDPVPPLNEGRWLWRRAYVFGATAGLLALAAFIAARSDQAALPRLAEGVNGLLALLLVLYLVAPTAQQLVELLANLRLRLQAGRGR